MVFCGMEMIVSGIFVFICESKFSFVITIGIKPLMHSIYIKLVITILVIMTKTTIITITTMIVTKRMTIITVTPKYINDYVFLLCFFLFFFFFYVVVQGWNHGANVNAGTFQQCKKIKDKVDDAKEETNNHKIYIFNSLCNKR